MAPHRPGVLCALVALVVIYAMTFVESSPTAGLWAVKMKVAPLQRSRAQLKARAEESLLASGMVVVKELEHLSGEDEAETRLFYLVDLHGELSSSFFFVFFVSSWSSSIGIGKFD